MIPNFFYHARMLAYDFGPRHPLRPERLRRTIELLGRFDPELNPIDPGEGDVADVLRVHEPAYVEAVQRMSHGEVLEPEDVAKFGFASGDNPPFPGMYEAALHYCAGAAMAGRAVRDGAKLAFNISGGLHHAHRSRASGFCIFNDPAITIEMLRERFDRVAYVDIDVHHGDGVQWLYYDDPNVLTCSIHESGRSLYPGTGFFEERGAANTSVNVSIPAHSTGDTWLTGFVDGILYALDCFEPEVIVLQMGTDSHFSDPLAHLRNTAEEWLQAVRFISDLGLPTVAIGGGGYSLTAVPRMWTAAVMTLSKVPFPDVVPADLAAEWRMPTMFDHELPQPRGVGLNEVKEEIRQLHHMELP